MLNLKSSIVAHGFHDGHIFPIAVTIVQHPSLIIIAMHSLLDLPGVRVKSCTLRHRYRVVRTADVVGGRCYY